MKKTTLFVFTLLVCFVSFGQERYQYKEPKQLNDDLKTNSLLSHTTDTSKTYNLFSEFINKEHTTHSFLLVHKGELIFEEYFGEYSINSQHDFHAVTESIGSILTGIAIDKGFIDNVNDLVSKYIKNPFPKKKLDPRKGKITIEHLLMMSSGLDCDDSNKKSKGRKERAYKEKDWLQYFFNLPMLNKPGTVSSRCSIGQVLAIEIISRASGMPINEFAEKYLFAPLRITNFSWRSPSKKEAFTSGKQLYMTSRDMAKIGLLVLHKGKWKEQQIVSEKWIQESTTPKTNIIGLDYGYSWWNISNTHNREEIIIKMVLDLMSGESISIYPELDLVIVHNNSNSYVDRTFTLSRFLDAFLSSLSKAE
ncbi:MAG: serine hydrolase [Flavobacteriaceae bacterium]